MASLASRSDGGSATVLEKAKRLIRVGAINLLLIFVVYSTLGGMFSIWGIRLQPGTMPNHHLIINLFYIYGVFGTYDLKCSEYIALGARKRLSDIAQTPKAEMLDLAVYDYFPQWRGEAHRRLSLLGYKYSGSERRQAAYRRMSTIIMRKHNAAHPDDQVQQVYIYLAEWPSDNRGYKARYHQRTYRLIGNN